MDYKLQKIYLDWYNNYLTIEKFAEANNLTWTEAGQLIDLSRSVHERLVKEYKEFNAKAKEL